MTWLCVILGLALQQAGPVAPEDIQARLRALVESTFEELTSEQKQEMVRTLTAPFLASPSPSSDRTKGLLDALPQALEYHSDRARSRALSVAGTPENLARALSSDGELRELLAEGFRIQAGYLAARIERSLAAPPPEVTHPAVRAQIDRLLSTAREVLVDKLPGQDGAAYVDRTLESWKKAWIGSLDDPLSPFLDRPIPEDDLRSVLDGMRQAAAAFPRMVLTTSDLANQERLDQLKVSELIRGVREGAYGVGTICYRSYDVHENRAREWKARIEASRFSLSETPGGRLPAPRPEEAGDPDGGTPAPGARKPAGAPAPQPKPPQSPTPRLKEQEAGVSRNTRLLIFGILAAAGLVVFFILRRKGSSRPAS